MRRVGTHIPQSPRSFDPDLAHIPKSAYSDVYEPSQDSFFLADVLRRDLLNRLRLHPHQPVGFASEHREEHDGSREKRACRSCPFILEVGSGSGFVSAFVVRFLTNALSGSDSFALFCSDLNPRACQTSLDTLSRNAGGGLEASVGEQRPRPPLSTFDVLNGSFMNPFRPLRPPCGAKGGVREGLFDVIIFNPPYVPSTEEEIHKGRRCVSQGPEATRKEKPAEHDPGLLALAYAGGFHGRVVIDEFLLSVGSHLRSGRGEDKGRFGVLYLLLISENRPLELLREAPARWGLRGVVVDDKRGLGEHLYVLRLWRADAVCVESCGCLGTFVKEKKKEEEGGGEELAEGQRVGEGEDEEEEEEEESDSDDFMKIGMTL